MPDSEPNPYASPATTGLDLAQRGFRWRVVPASMAFGLGLLLTAFGLFAVCVMSYVVIWQNQVDHTEKEQQRIADCLSTLDARVGAEAGKLAALKTHKKGLMQQLFPAPHESVSTRVCLPSPRYSGERGRG